MILSFSCNDVCCYLSDLSLPTCLILSDKHIRGVSTETRPDVRLDRLPSENDEIRRPADKQTLSGRSSSGMCFGRRCCCWR